MEANNITADFIRGEVKRLIAEVTERAPEEIGDTASFGEELGVDSLMAMEIMFTVDKKFKIQVPEEEYTKVKNVDDTVMLVQRYLPQATTGAAGA
jgi:acyl carrier protein